MTGKSIACVVILTTVLVAASVRCHARDCTASQHKTDKARMEAAFGAGILKNDKDAHPGVFISENYWRRLTFAETIEFTETLSCAVAGVGKALSDMRFRSDMTGKVVGVWSWGTLTVP